MTEQRAAEQPVEKRREAQRQAGHDGEGSERSEHGENRRVHEPEVVQENAEHRAKADESHRSCARADALPRAGDDGHGGSEHKRAEQQREGQSMRSRQVPGRVVGLVAVPLHDEGHEAEVESAERARQQQRRNVAFGKRDGARGRKRCDCGQREEDLLHGDLGAEPRIGEARIDRKQPRDGNDADRDAVKDERQRGAEQSEPSGRQKKGDCGPADAARRGRRRRKAAC